MGTNYTVGVQVESKSHYKETQGRFQSYKQRESWIKILFIKYNEEAFFGLKKQKVTKL